MGTSKTRHPSVPSLAALALAACTAACVHVDLAGDLALEPERPVDPAPVVVREVVVAYEGAGDTEAPAPSALPASPRDRPIPDPVPFRLGAGRGALGRIDLVPCREEGLPQGYVHMRVTFRHDGRVVHAAVETPAEPPPEALTCIAEQLEVAMVPGFDGGDVTLSKSYFVN